MEEPALSEEVLRRAAARPDAPPRLLKAADAVRDGKFSWAEVVAGECDHPKALALFTRKASETLWPLLRQVADEVEAAKPGRDEKAEPREVGTEDEYYDTFQVLRRAYE